MANDHNFKVKNGLDVGGHITLTGSSAVIFDTQQAGLGGDLGIRGSGESFQIFEPEDANKVWLEISDDPVASNTAFKINSSAGMSSVFHDQYHPNADKWTTARTITLTGDVTGSTSIDGSANVSITTTVANDSHSHSNYLIKTGDTATGTITFNGQVNLNQWVYMDVAGQNFVLNSDTVNRNTLEWQQNSTRVWTLDLQADGDLNFVPSSGDVVRISDNRIFDDGYHPNADKWTTARTNTVTLTGDVSGSGSASVDGTGNWTVSVPAVVANDSHTHSNYVLKTGDTMTGALTISSTVQNLLNIYNNTNAGGATINFSDNSGQGQTGQITFYHSDAQSPGSAYGASFKFNTDQPNLAVILDETGDYFVGTNKVFHDGYHPNADKWTTARTNTVTLTGSVTGTGSASVDGSGNWTVTVPTTTNHTHNYDNYVSWTAEDGDGTQYTVTSGDVLKFAEGSGINVNFSADDVLRIEYNGSEIPTAANLNTYRTTGFYTQNSNADAAAGSNYPTANAGILQVINDDYGNGLHTTQLYSQYNSTNYYHRTYYNGGWSAWRNLAQDTTYTVGNGAMSVTAGGGLTGGGQVGTANQTGSSSVTISHADTSTQASVNNSNGTVIQDITLDTYGHITAIGSVNLDSRYQLIAAPAAPTITNTTLSGETVEIVFSQSATAGVNGYEIWSDGGGVSFALIGRIPAQDIAASMSFVDTTFTDTGTINYRVYAIRNGVYSTAATTTATFSVPSLDVANFAAIPDLNAFYLQYDLPVTRFLDHIEIYLDTNASSGSLARANATLIYSGDNPSYVHNISASDRDNYHQFWVECVGVA